jgi:hypothetical protein
MLQEARLTVLEFLAVKYLVMRILTGKRQKIKNNNAWM